MSTKSIMNVTDDIYFLDGFTTLLKSNDQPKC